LRDFFFHKVSHPSIKIDDPKYQPYGAFEWALPSKPNWTEPLGQKLCILDLDSRPLDSDGHIFGPNPINWTHAESIHGPSLGILQHWVYAKIHGYAYYFVRTGEFEDRRASWKKPTIIDRVLQKHRVCVFVDSDAIFNHLDLPFEWLLNYWDIRDTDSVSLAIDPDLPHNKDEKGKLYLNTGFIIAQNQSTTFSIMHDWASCVDGDKYPNCTEYRTKSYGHPSDQGGFGNYVRYDYEDNIKELPCAEANGFAEHGSECLGTFIKHLWTGKRDLIKIAVGQQIPGDFLRILHEQMLKEKDKFFVTEEELLGR
ncbi:hypothetical protein SODALDRAFT_284849, partial [Sodiomyces alkalinus F11]